MALMKANGAVLIDDEMNIIEQQFTKTNFSIGANSTAIADIAFTVPSGYKVKAITDFWIDSTGTTSPAGATYCVVVNHWGYTSPTHCSIRNFSNSNAKVTVNCRILFVKAP